VGHFGFSAPNYFCQRVYFLEISPANIIKYQIKLKNLALRIGIYWMVGID
jgi:hypothetical protein